jgi:transcriptional regulator with XRE-family HTH domain
MNVKPGIGRALRIIRAVRGITQKELARRVRVKPSYISLLEAGKRDNPSTEFLTRLSKEAVISELTIATLSMDYRELKLAPEEIKRDLGEFLLGSSARKAPE